MSQTASFRRENPKESDVYLYLSKSLNVVIREMSALPDFKPDPAWIGPRLRGRFTRQEIKTSLVFLARAGFIANTSKGEGARPSERQLDCSGPVLDAALAQFHTEMLTRAAQSITEVSATERQVLGHTFAIPASFAGELSKILTGAQSAIQQLEIRANKDQKPEVIYHVALAGYPLTRIPK